MPAHIRSFAGRRGGLALTAPEPRAAEPPFTEPAFAAPAVTAMPEAGSADTDTPASRVRFSIAAAWRDVTRGVEWTLVYVAFLAYMVGIITTRFRIGTATMVLAVIGVALQRRPFRFGPLGMLMGAFTVWAGISGLTSPYSDAIQDSLTDFLKLGVVLIAGLNALRTRAQLRFCLIVILVAFAAYPGRGSYLNYITGANLVFGRVIWNGPYGNPNDLAGITLVMVGFCACVATTAPPGLARLGARIGIPLLALLIAFTQSRGALIALAVLGVIALVRAPKHQRTRALLGGLLVGAVFVAFAPSTMWDRLQGLQYATSTEDLGEVDQDGSAKQRFEIWRVASGIIADHPVFGVGFGAYKLAHAQYSIRPEYNPIARGNRDTHSTYLNVLAETGVVGFALFCALVGTAFLAAERTRRAMRTIDPTGAQGLLWLELTIVAYFIAGIWGSYGKIHITYVLLLITWAYAQTFTAPALAAEPDHARLPQPST